MQTFLPYPDFAESAKVLDRQRLGKQRVEAYQIIRTLMAGEKAGWANHPAVKMWRGHGVALLAYLLVVCDEWTSRGYKDSVREKVLDEVSTKLGMDPEGLEANARQELLGGHIGAPYGGLPAWLGDPAFHASHRSNLLRKAPDWYEQFGWTESHDLEYVWPVQDEPEVAASDVGEGEADELDEPGAEPSPAHSEDDAGYSHSDPLPAPDLPPPSAGEQAQGEHDMAKAKEAPAESSYENMNRGDLVDALRAKGWDGPTSYGKGRLIEMLETLDAGGTIETPKRGRKGGDDAGN